MDLRVQGWPAASRRGAVGVLARRASRLWLTACDMSRSQFVTSIPVNDEDEEAAASAHVQSLMPKAGARMSFTAPLSLIAENEKEGEMVDPMEAHRASRVSDRDDEAQFIKSTSIVPVYSKFTRVLTFRICPQYKARRRQRIISPERHDPFAAGDQVCDVGRRCLPIKPGVRMQRV